MSRFVALLAAMALVVAACEAESSPAATPAGTTAAATGTAEPTGTAAPADDGSGEVVEVTVGTDDGAELLFVPDEVTVPAGTTVRLTFMNESTVPHNLTFEGPTDAATATIVDPGAEETIEFTAPDPGEYTFVCTLHPGMEGTLLVEEG